MPTIRIGFSSDFVLNNNRVGLGTTVAAGGNLDVDGTIKGNFSVTGVSTLASYGGFVVQKQQVNKPSTIGFATVGLGITSAATGVGATHVANQYYEVETGFTDLGGVHHGDDQYFNTLSEDLVIDDGQILNITNTEMVGLTTIGEYDRHNHSSYVCAGSLEQVSVTGHFSVPNGGSNDRQETPIEGTVRFNDDLNTLEFFNGNEWRQFTYNQGQSGRAVYGAGQTPSNETSMEYFSLASGGQGIAFGDLSGSPEIAAWGKFGNSSETRGLFSGGYHNPTTSHVNTIDYITIASAGDSKDFGDLVTSSGIGGVVSSSTRGIQAGGWVNPAGTPNDTNVIQYVEMSTTGNSLDFGDLTKTKRSIAGAQSPTRGLFAGGEQNSNQSNLERNIEYITIASLGNTQDFGELIERRRWDMYNLSNSVRGVFAGAGYNHFSTRIQYVNIATTGNAEYFGELVETSKGNSGAASQTRGVSVGGVSPSVWHGMQSIIIATAGNAIDFGDLSQRIYGACISDSHGGLGGF